MRSLIALVVVLALSACASAGRTPDGYTIVQWQKNPAAFEEARKLGLRLHYSVGPDSLLGFRYFDGEVSHLYAPDPSTTGRSVSERLEIRWHVVAEGVASSYVRSGARCDVYAPDPPLIPNGKRRGTYRNGQWRELGLMLGQCFNGPVPAGHSAGDWDTLGHEFVHAVKGAFHD